MASRQEYIQLARTLPSSLQRFLARYPPPTILNSTTAAAVNPSLTPTTSTETSDAAPAASDIADANSQPTWQNPFLPQKNPVTHHWLGPKYSLRRQRKLYKLAENYGVESLLPFSKKSSAYRQQRATELGLRVKGTGEGQKVKGHKWERTMRPKLEARKKAMMEMPELIQKWKEAAHGRKWKKWPK